MRTRSQALRGRRPDVHRSAREPDLLVRQEVVRDFSPGEIDLDDLAEAIRHLLNADCAQPRGLKRRRDPHLLSPRRRGTHVMGSNEMEAPGS